MKNIIIGGVPRSGKTTLAKHLKRELKYSIIPGDALVSTFGEVFPELGISHFSKDHGEACLAFRSFFLEFIHHLEYEDIPFIIDSYHILPRDMQGLSDSFHILFMGYPSTDVSVKYAEIRENSRLEDWTQSLSDTQLSELVQRYINESKQLFDSCKKMGLQFIDTSTDFNNTIDNSLNKFMLSVY